ncbi:uncharacterized protein GGS22DRAFT_196718 [Annulohypoxylon maeteangense]|uniref:uncharacterized protein n=1 Tax=Annulohypoxylon maeteangense TaxID=1927788 RepID=UPI0020072453|nr:uncharacterized protein GGS22DRAFT_196718 [Annulohypoxylon maeteangense]KAI0888941.1 hypothetical protein GGS22DRAFT_196718 [Annulohypoxylon maeteangense]
MLTPQSTGGSQNGFISSQPGSTSKRWNKEELRKCCAIGTTELLDLNLQGQIHPIFANWVDTDLELRKELEQSLLLASRMLDAAGLPWISDFLSHDLFTEEYPGRKPSCRCSFTHSAAGPMVDGEIVPRSILRHHRATWASDEVKGEWISTAECQIRGRMARSLTWQLDADMFSEKGRVGYTCRHPRDGLALDEIDRYETIQEWDKKCEDGWRNQTILVAAEFPQRLAELRRQGKENNEEYLLTSFMAAITLLHELGHAVYWKDSRALTLGLHEPYYGADLQMELGDSFVASIFGGWIPVPIKDFAQLPNGLSFSEGLAWRQILTWDLHRLRPKHRAHYSIPVDYIARLFSDKCWLEAQSDTLGGLIQPRTLESATKDLSMSAQVAADGHHAMAAIPDFHCSGQGWMWNRLLGARFRIPQYDGHLCPDLDLPVATDDVIEEPRPLPPLQPSPVITPASTAKTSNPGTAVTTATLDDTALPSSPFPDSPRIELFPKPPRRKPNVNINIKVNIKNKKKPVKPVFRREHTEKIKENNKSEIRESKGDYKKKTAPSFIRLAKDEQKPLSPDRSEISVDELRNRLSQLLGISFDELERFFEASRCA